jgi:hypothetical protein
VQGTDEPDEDPEQEARDAGNAMAGALSSMFGGGGGDVKHKGNYDFKNSIEMEMEVYDDDSGEVGMVMDYVTYFNSSSNDIAMDIKPRSEGSNYQGNMTMIIDQDNQLMLMLTSQGGQKMAIASSLDDIPEEGDTEDTGDSSNATYTKNGKTKTVAGYKCDGYTMTDGDSKVDMWVTDAVDFKAGKKEMKKAGIPMYYDGPFDGGMIMEMEAYEAGRKQMKMIVKDIKKNISKSFTMNGYTIMKMDMGGE